MSSTNCVRPLFSLSGFSLSTLTIRLCGGENGVHRCCKLSVGSRSDLPPSNKKAATGCVVLLRRDHRLRLFLQQRRKPGVNWRTDRSRGQRAFSGSMGPVQRQTDRPRPEPFSAPVQPVRRQTDRSDQQRHPLLQEPERHSPGQPRHHQTDRQQPGRLVLPAREARRKKDRRRLALRQDRHRRGLPVLQQEARLRRDRRQRDRHRRGSPVPREARLRRDRKSVV